MSSILTQQTKYSKAVATILTVAFLVLALAVSPVAMGLGDDPSIDAVLNDSNYNNTDEIGFNDSATFEIQLTNINDSEVNSYDWRVEYVPNVFEVADEQVVDASTTTNSGDVFNLSNGDATNLTSAVANNTSSGGGQTDITDNVSLNKSTDEITVNYALNSSEELLVDYEHKNSNDELVTENFSGQSLTYTFENDVPTDVTGEVEYTDENGNTQTLTNTEQVLDSGGSIGSIQVGDNQIPVVPVVGGFLGVLVLLGGIVALKES